MNENQILSLRSSSRSRFVSSFAIALVVLFAATITFASTPQGTFDKTLQVSGPVDLEVLTHSGDVTIRAGSSGSVSIHGKIFVGDRWLRGSRQSDVQEIAQHPPIRQDGNSVHIDYVNAHDISVDYEITVPADTVIRTHSGSGDQTIEGTRGNVDIQTGSGDVKLKDLTGEVRLQTGSGDVRAHEISGAVKGGAGSGDIEVEETGSGDNPISIPARATFTCVAFRAASTARLVAVTSRRKARRAAPGKFALVPATCRCGCPQIPRSMPTFPPVRARSK